jgi:tRNA dimethylallyltransferase
MRYLDDEYDRAEAIELIKVHTHQYAKRQMTWFRRYENMYRVQLGGCEVEKETALEKIFRHIDAEL